MAVKSAGALAEQAVANFLRKSGYKILDQNWRTAVCEVDIIARKKQEIYLVEVKYRQTSSFGDGFDYITAHKRKKLELATKIWQSEHNWCQPINLLAAAVEGQNFENIKLIAIF